MVDSVPFMARAPRMQLRHVRVNCLTLLSFVPEHTVAYVQTLRPVLLLVLLTR
jgi:hypothetical protein